MLLWASVFLPPLILGFGLPRFFRSKDYTLLLSAACILYMVSWLLPSPEIDGRQTEFVTHFVGGGVFTGLLWLYIKNVRQWHARWWIELGSVYAMVSSLGVLNELYEYLLWRMGMMPGGILDTTWDLLANTLGAMMLFGLYKLWYVRWPTRR